MFETKKARSFIAERVNHSREANSNLTQVAGKEFRSTICSPREEFAMLVKNLIAVVVITTAVVGIAAEETAPKPNKPADQVSDKLRNRLDGVEQRLATLRSNVNALTKQGDQALH